MSDSEGRKATYATLLAVGLAVVGLTACSQGTTADPAESSATAETAQTDGTKLADTNVPQAKPAPAPSLSGGTPDLGAPPPAKQIFQRKCAICHTEQGIKLNGRFIPTLDQLRGMQASKVYNIIANGIMQPQAKGISDRDMRAIAEMITGTQLEGGQDTGISAMTNVCKKNPPLADPSSMPAWNGWSPGTNNARHQNAKAAGLTAADVPNLELKWAFGLPLGASSGSQPTVVSGRVFVGSDNATIYSINAKTGCAYWSYKTTSPGRAAPIVKPIKGYAGTKYALYYATGDLTLYALDAHTGKLLWKKHLKNKGNGLSGSPSYYDGRLYVPLTSQGVTAGFAPQVECCKSRGAVVAVNAQDGSVIWRAESIEAPARKISINKSGTQVWGPGGASVWNSPTIDPKRGLVYVGTGNSYGPIAAKTSDSILALSMEDGHIVWHYQLFDNDAFMLGCPKTSPPGQICPQHIGMDWDFGGSSAILQKLPNGKSVLVAAGKGGVAIGLDPDNGKLLWKTKLYEGTPPTADGLVLFGGTADGERVYYPLQTPGGGLKALDLATGHIDWDAEINADPRGQAGPASSIPGVVFTGGWDGILRAVNMDGEVIWTYDTRQRYDSVNGVIAIGGSLGSAGATIANGMVFIASGYPGFQKGTPGNVVLAFGLPD